MSHAHNVFDMDHHFRIDPITRSVTNAESKKTKLMQGDHNSECFSFEIDKVVEGHDMTLCNVVRIHYINVDSSRVNKNNGLYEVKDLAVSETDASKVVFTWTVSNQATMYAGGLSFLIEFKCVNDDGTVAYKWHSDINNSISIASGIDNSDYIAEEYADVIEQWTAEILDLNGQVTANTEARHIHENGEVLDLLTDKHVSGNKHVLLYGTNPIWTMFDGKLVEYIEKLNENGDMVISLNPNPQSIGNTEQYVIKSSDDLRAILNDIVVVESNMTTGTNINDEIYEYGSIDRYAGANYDRDPITSAFRSKSYITVTPGASIQACYNCLDGETLYGKVLMVYEYDAAQYYIKRTALYSNNLETYEPQTITISDNTAFIRLCIDTEDAVELTQVKIAIYYDEFAVPEYNVYDASKLETHYKISAGKIVSDNIIINGTGLDVQLDNTDQKISDLEKSLEESTSASHTHDNKDSLDKLLVKNYNSTGDLLHIGASTLWSDFLGGLIEKVEKDASTGDISIFHRKIPLMNIPSTEIKIKQHYKTSELTNDSGFIKEEDLAAAVENYLAEIWAAIDEIGGGVDEIEAIIDESGVLDE